MGRMYRLVKDPPMLASVGAGMGWGIIFGLHLAHQYGGMGAGTADYIGTPIAIVLILIWAFFMIRNSERVPDSGGAPKESRNRI
jgi:hypothetical protein